MINIHEMEQLSETGPDLYKHYTSEKYTHYIGIKADPQKDQVKCLIRLPVKPGFWYADLTSFSNVL